MVAERKLLAAEIIDSDSDYDILGCIYNFFTYFNIKYIALWLKTFREFNSFDKLPSSFWTFHIKELNIQVKSSFFNIKILALTNFRSLYWYFTKMSDFQL